METTITLTLGGEPRSLDFTRNGFLEHIEDATGQDPFEWFDRFKPKENGHVNKITTTMKDAAIIAYAGMNSFQDLKDFPPIPLEQVRRWMRSVPTKDVGKTLSALYEAVLVVFSGETEEVVPNPEAPLSGAN